MTTKPETCPEKVFGYQIPIRGYEYWEFDANPLIGEGFVNIEYVRHDIAAARELAIIRATLEAAAMAAQKSPFQTAPRIEAEILSIDPATILKELK